MLVVATAGNQPSEQELRRLVAEDAIPEVILAEDAFGAVSLNDRDLQDLPGVGGQVLRALPLPLALALAVWRRRAEFDVVMSWGEQLALPIAMFRALGLSRNLSHIGILIWPFDMSSESRLKRAFKRHLMPALVRHGIDRVFTPSPRQQQLLHERWGIPRGRLIDARLPVDTRFWRPLAGAGDMICAVGREMRDYETLLAALAPLEIPCHIAVGAGTRRVGGQTEDVRARNVGDRPLPANVSVGPKTALELRELYARSRFVVIPILPSQTDNGTTAIAEAMAMGRAVITTATVGRAAVLADGENCLLVAPRDAAGLRAAIEELWSDPARCRQLGAEGRRRIAAEQSIEQWVVAFSRARDELQMY